MALKLAFKLIITSTAVYYTNQLEIWEPLSSKPRAYDRLIADAKKIINENKPKALKLNLPNVVNQDLCATTNYYYNNGVIKSVNFLAQLPSNACALYDRTVKQISATLVTGPQPK